MLKLVRHYQDQHGPEPTPGFAAAAWRFVVRLKENLGYESALESFQQEHPDTPEMVFVEGGSFQMGSIGFRLARPSH